MQDNTKDMESDASNTESEPRNGIPQQYRGDAAIKCDECGVWRTEITEPCPECGADA